MNEKTGLISAGAGIAGRNKRYVIWFYLLNLVLASLGAGAFSAQVHGIFDHSLYADRVLHGFDAAVFGELLARPEFGPVRASTAPAVVFAVLFFLLTMLFLPGVLLGYASDHRLPRDEFWRACGRNVWRFVRLFLFFAVIAGSIAGIMFGVQGALAKAAEKSSYEKLPFFIQLGCMAIIFLVMTAVRAWFDLAETDVVVSDQGAVRKSVAFGFRNARRNLGRLLGSYVVIAIVGVAILAAGISLWEMIVPASSVLGAFIISQAILLLLLATRFWQRAAAVAFYVRRQVETPVLEMPPLTSVSMPELPVAQPGSGT
jgi:hypothetical protein